MRRLLILAALALVAAAPARKPVAQPSGVAGRDWSQVAVRLPSGGFLQGNPNARVRLVEYLSLTCPHCAHMEAVAIPSLTRDHVRTGKVSYEVRPAIRDGVDVVATAFARCLGPRAFFAVLPPLYAGQPQWLERGYAYLQSAVPAEEQPTGQALGAIAKASGLDAFFAAHGLPATRQAACLAGPEPKTLSDMAQRIWTPDFPGTPTFEVNGTRIGAVGSWEELRAKLVAAGA